jgi:phosphate transport system substrate-binding protein
MKKILFISMVLGMVLGGGCERKPKPASTGSDLSGTISMSGAWALYPMAVKWAEEFRKVHPGVQIDISAGGAGKGMADCLSGAADLGMVSRAINPAELEKGAWAVAVTKDAVIATVNRDNPVIGDLLKKGITRKQCMDLWIQGVQIKWGALTDGDCAEPVHVYTRSDACGAAETWAQYMGKKQEDLKGLGVFGDPGVAEAVRQDVLGIGFNNVNYAYDAATKKPMDQLAVVPLDVNENGVIDPEESFYEDRDALTAAIAAGRYPSPPARDLYLVSKGRPAKKEVAAFLRWILTEGQAFVSEAGYVNLSAESIAAELKKLDE